jgi:hypothetical protein
MTPPMNSAIETYPRIASDAAISRIAAVGRKSP